MPNTECNRCKESFLSNHINDVRTCPYCGFLFKVADYSGMRRTERVPINNICNFLKDSSPYSTQAYQISKHGIAIKSSMNLPLNLYDCLNIVINDFELKSEVKVVWLEKQSNGTTIVGMEFC